MSVITMVVVFFFSLSRWTFRSHSTSNGQQTSSHNNSILCFSSLLSALFIAPYICIHIIYKHRSFSCNTHTARVLHLFNPVTSFIDYYGTKRGMGVCTENTCYYRIKIPSTFPYLSLSFSFISNVFLLNTHIHATHTYLHSFIHPNTNTVHLTFKNYYL